MAAPLYIPSKSAQFRDSVLLNLVFLLPRTVPVIWGWCSESVHGGNTWAGGSLVSLTFWSSRGSPQCQLQQGQCRCESSKVHRKSHQGFPLAGLGLGLWITHFLGKMSKRAATPFFKGLRLYLWKLVLQLAGRVDFSCLKKPQTKPSDFLFSSFWKGQWIGLALYS